MKKIKLTGKEIILSNHDDILAVSTQEDEHSQKDKLLIKIEAGISVLPIKEKLLDYQKNAEEFRQIHTVLFQDSDFTELQHSTDEINNLLEIIKKLPEQTKTISFCFSNLGNLGFENVYRIAEAIAQTLGESIKELDLRACGFNFLGKLKRKEIKDLFPEGVVKLTKWQLVDESNSPDDENENERHFHRIYQYDHKEIMLGKTIISQTTKAPSLMVSYTSFGSHEGSLIIHPRHKMTPQELEQKLGYRVYHSMPSFPEPRWEVTLDTENESNLDYFIHILDDNEALEELKKEIYDFLELKPSPDEVLSLFESDKTEEAIEQLKRVESKGCYIFVWEIADYFFNQLITLGSETKLSLDTLYEMYGVITMENPYYQEAQMRKLEILDTQGNSRELSEERFTVALGYKPQPVVDQRRVDMLFHELSGKSGAPNITNLPSASALIDFAKEMSQLRQECAELRAYKEENEGAKRRAEEIEALRETGVSSAGIFGQPSRKKIKMTEANPVVSPGSP
ncbi:hypothetical protein Lqui_2175 [Legionella quinlivanii]|uniref:Uncharacterized protein n=1 Tax=Legionella quinlivanii TaxID=45073 RepID=A0A0W0XSW8_9GAMM|nr:hypothetical protein [Legionella quinlivanii]KTD47911.1 hypothetical protein Lqui_2175 [Legionella quinlivanii]SEG36897.1 hypothetical protein SAMN02746093_02682 [Legionella quinlivanii DSM 21216]STY10095.1 Uncharacterised protein [Legionella quinlivanii]